MSAYISLPMYASSLRARLRLYAGQCRQCETVNYPPRQHCVNCNGAQFSDIALSGRGTLYSYSIIAAGGAPAEFDQQQAMTGEIVVGIIQLAEGPRVIGQLIGVGRGELRIGLNVRAAARRLFAQEGIVRYGIKFSAEPADKAGISSGA